MNDLVVPAEILFRPRRRIPIITLLTTALLSTLSNSLTNLAIPWFVLSVTGSVQKMGVVAAATMVPQALMAMFGGAVADRMSPKRLSIGSDVLSGVTVAMIPLLHWQEHLSFGILLALCVAGAVFDGPGSAARRKMTPVLTERGGLPLERVNAFSGMTQATSMILGTLLGGVLIGLMGASNVLWINAATFLISVLAMVLLIPDVHVPRAMHTSFSDDLRQGFAFVRTMPLLKLEIPIALSFNMLVSPLFAVLMPFLAKTVWHSAGRYGVIMSGFGAGILCGSLAYGWLGQRVRPSLLMRVSMALVALALWLLVALPAWQLTWVSVFCIGLTAGTLNPLFSTLVMKATPHDLLGRVNGVIDSGAMAAAPVGVMLTAPFVAHVGLTSAFTVFALVGSCLPVATLIANLPAMTDHLSGPNSGR